MSKISLAPDASGTGIFTIASPNSNTNRTLTLPDDTGTIVTNSGNQAGSFTTLNTSGAVVFNDAGADVDFRVESDTVENALFVDGATGNIGLGTTTAVTKATVYGSGDQKLSLVSPTGSSTQVGINLSPSMTDAEAAANPAQAAIYATDSSYSANIIFANKATGAVGNALTERMRVTSDGYLRMASGSGGIQFNGDTAAANALDDYEEGNWTPVISDGTNNATMSVSAQGRYTKIGNLVTVTGYPVTTALGSVSGNVRITGLPITGAAGAGNYVSGCVGYAEGLNISANQVVGMYVSETNYIVLTLCDSTAGTTNLQASEWSAGGGIFIALTYRT